MLAIAMAPDTSVACTRECISVMVFHRNVHVKSCLLMNMLVNCYSANGIIGIAHCVCKDNTCKQTTVKVKDLLPNKRCCKTVGAIILTPSSL